MIIDLRTILTAPRRFDFTLEPGWWQGDEEDDQILGLDSPPGSSNKHLQVRE